MGTCVRAGLPPHSNGETCTPGGGCTELEEGGGGGVGEWESTGAGGGREEVTPTHTRMGHCCCFCYYCRAAIADGSTSNVRGREGKELACCGAKMCVSSEDGVSGPHVCAVPLPPTQSPPPPASLHPSLTSPKLTTSHRSAGRSHPARKGVN